jgi:hypothetical protein
MFGALPLPKFVNESLVDELQELGFLLVDCLVGGTMWENERNRIFGSF